MQKIRYIFLVYIMSILLLCSCQSSVTPATTSNENTVSPIPSTIPSATPSMTSLPQESDSEKDLLTLSLKAYSAVLQNNTEFLSKDDNKKTYLKDFRYLNNDDPDSPLTVVSFAAVDMDGDKIPEIVLEGDNYIGYEVLHYYEGIVYGYSFVYKGYGKSES